MLGMGPIIDPVALIAAILVGVCVFCLLCFLGWEWVESDDD